MDFIIMYHVLLLYVTIVIDCVKGVLHSGNIPEKTIEAEYAMR